MLVQSPSLLSSNSLLFSKNHYQVESHPKESTNDVGDQIISSKFYPRIKHSQGKSHALCLSQSYDLHLQKDDK